MNSHIVFSEGDKEPRKMMIEDWEIGALFWNCPYRTDGDEQAARLFDQIASLDHFIDNMLRDAELYRLGDA